MPLLNLECDYCGAEVLKLSAQFARSGPRAFCNRTCSGLGRRKGKTDEQKRAEKAAYDREYRAANMERIRSKKAAYFQRTYDPDKARIERKKTMPRHVAYCRRPEYRRVKSMYDAERRSAAYGAFADCHALVLAVEAEVDARASHYDIRLQQGTINKAQKRKRALS